MRSFRTFLVISIFLIGIIGVIAGKSRYFDTYQLYGYNSSTGYTLLICGSAIPCAGVELKAGFAGGSPAVISYLTATYGLYLYDLNTGVYLPLQLR
jgi:hypothetical protein